MIVSNRQPTLSAPYRIAFIGEAPGEKEEVAGQPFVGPSGRLLWGLCSKAGIVREASFTGNVCQVRPPHNEIAHFDWDGPEIREGLSKLEFDLKKFKPHLVVCLGATSLHAFKHPERELRKRKTREGVKFVYPDSIDSWRGSLFLSNRGAPLEGVKCLATHHPAYCLRNFKYTPLLLFDLFRARKQGEFFELILPKREFVLDPTLTQLLDLFHSIRKDHTPTSIDIEGGLNGMPCISIATSANAGFIIPFINEEGLSCWSVEEELQLVFGLAQLLADPNVPKIFQNGLYDRFVLQYGFGMPVLGNEDDTMLKFWEKYCELPKSLGVQASILTDEPYYKFERKSGSTKVLFNYCCKDSAVTFEINEKLGLILNPVSTAHYRMNMDILNVFLYIELRGIRYASDLAALRLKETNTHIYRLQHQLDVLSGIVTEPTEADAREIMCYKRDPSKVKKAYQEHAERIFTLLRQPERSDEEQGYISTVLHRSMNTKSSEFKAYLYDKLELPASYNEETGSPSTDYYALLSLFKKTQNPAVRLAIDIGVLRTRAQNLRIPSDPDGRIRCGYNVVGTKTGRVTSYESPTGSGYNLHTIPGEDPTKPEGHPLRLGMQDLFLADEGCWFFKCDLKGSDGWTIGAHLNRLGSPLMLNDLQSGIKPAARVCFMLRHGPTSLRGLTREEVKGKLKEVKKEDWDYFACKIGIWGICYLMGPDLLAEQIAEESEGTVWLSRKEVYDLHKTVFEGYQVKLWHDWMTRQLAKKPELVTATGHTRRFFGRKDEILGSALSHEPQIVTTYATNLAALRLWLDPENRGDRRFRIEPLHQVHDALCGQFRKEDTDWALPKIREWFNNEILIAGQKITIPFDGAYGPSWGQLDEGVI